ncbi:ceramidase-domain-containing protein [Jimgerdemannia flammicorona]|uniref:Ceramidase-domain-containing protein n=1 Tax=Jimgerdemannia flammicorona TaxID=994334 RepID=A0A433QSP3_9FUNG|nr:ceramidase-domain-containing protein [Jimgerdemannia flammicorona]
MSFLQENYEISPYIAEFINTTTNLVFEAGALLIYLLPIKETKSRSAFLSFTHNPHLAFDSRPLHLRRLQRAPQWHREAVHSHPPSFETSAQIRHGYKLGLGLFAYAAFVTVTYVYFVHDPVFHQVSYGLLVVIIVGRSTYLVHRLPLSETRRILVFVLRTAASSFLGAFILWNIDNIFCSSLRGWRKNLGIYPVGAVSELHGWWHIGTALGCYYYIVFNEWIQQILAGNSQVFELHWALGFVPYIRKAEGSVKTAANDHVETKKKK